MVNVGDQVLLVAGGVSVFEVLGIEGEHATVQAVEGAESGRYPFPARVSALVPAVATASKGDADGE